MCVNKSNICAIFLAVIGLSFTEAKDELEPLVAFHCGRPAIHQTPLGWIADNGTDCLAHPEDILAFCQKSFPNLDIRNYVEANDEVVVDRWCDFAGEDCDQSFQVQPVQCMVGPFIVVDPVAPDRCLVDRMIRATECKTSMKWKSVAFKYCAEHGMETSWFSIMQPCDIGKFSGVQYVCCPPGKVSIEVVNSFPALVSESSSTARPAEAPKDSVVNDVYLDRGSEPETEHSRYLSAKEELHKKHDDEVSKIMDAWDEAQREVEKMKTKDSDMAEKLEKKITARFQKTINTLEVKEVMEKRQMDSVHDQKVQVELNNKKREAMEVYLAVLSDRKHATLKDILKVLKHYVRVEEKDRMHAINHYMHVKETDPAAAESIRALVAEHLRTIGLRVNRAREMLNRVPDYKDEIQNRIKDLLDEYQEFDELESSIVQLVATDAGGNRSSPKEEEEEDVEEDADENEGEERLEVDGKADNSLEAETDLGALESKKDLGNVALAGYKDEAEGVNLHNTEVLKTENVQQGNEGVVEIKPVAHPSHMGSNELRLEERNSLVEKHSSGSSLGALMFILTGCIFLVTVTILGVLVWRRQAGVARRRRKIADDSMLLASPPEQVHIASMQVNGYENPTYKYFEAKTTV